MQSAVSTGKRITSECFVEYFDHTHQTWAQSRFASCFGFMKPKLLRQKLRFCFSFITQQKASASLRLHGSQKIKASDQASWSKM